MKFSGVFSFFLVVLFITCAVVDARKQAKLAKNVMAHRAVTQATTANASMNLVNTNGGRVVLAPLSHYFFYYGDFSATSPDSQTPAVVQQFITDAADTPYLNTVTQYTAGSKFGGGPTTTTIRYAGASFITGYPYGKVLATTTDTCVPPLIKTFITQFNVPLNNNTQYYLITSSDVSFSTAICQDTAQACGYHSNFPKYNKNQDILYGWVGSDFNGCYNNGPYNDPTNSVVNVLSHEIFETLTDPYANAWFNGAGNEIGDLCNFNFGTSQFSSSIKQGAKYTIKLNGHEYMVQLEWSNAVAGCVIATNFTTPPPPAVSASPAVLPSLVPGVSQSGSMAALVFPSAGSTVAAGASPSNTLQVRASASADPTLSAFPSINPTNGVCVSCFEPKCHYTLRIQKLCEKTLGGTFTVTNSTSSTVAGKTCCTNLKNPSASFSWIQTGVANCEYGGIPTKKLLWCEALGGHITCVDNLTTSFGVRYTCNR